MYRNRSSSLDAIEMMHGDLSFVQMQEKLRNMKVRSNYAVKQMMVQEYVKQEKLRQTLEAAEVYDEEEKDINQNTGIMDALRQTFRRKSMTQDELQHKLPRTDQ
jgi:hypothetical protein